jgi:hypothetical protein
MWVAKQIDDVLVARNEVGRPAKRKWRGSLLGGCIRAHWYSANKVPMSEPFDGGTLRIFAMGHAVSAFLEEALREAYGDKIQFEVPVVSEKDNFSGNIDGLITLDDRRIVLEFKSIKHNGFIRLSDAKPEHKVQASAYARFYADSLSESERDAVNIETWVVYVSKDAYEIKEFEVEVVWENRAQRVLDVLNYYGDRLPPRLPNASKRKWPCGWCNWRTECLGGAK